MSRDYDEEVFVYADSDAMNWRGLSHDIHRRSGGRRGWNYNPSQGFWRDRYQDGIHEDRIDFLIDTYQDSNGNSFLVSKDGREAVDWNFIANKEGGQKTQGYIVKIGENPAPNSGVTIATGFDLGEKTKSGLLEMGLSPTLVNKLEPYLGLKGEKAKKALDDKPLNIGVAEANEIDRLVRQDIVSTLSNRFNAAAQFATFEQLDPALQTVITSVAYQYGSLGTKTPRFWGFVTNGQWLEAVNELKDFGDDFPSRREAEAELLFLAYRKASVREAKIFREMIRHALGMRGD